MARLLIEGKAKVIGKRNYSYDFEDKSGERKSGSGIELYLAQDCTDGEGVIAERCFVGEQKDYFEVAYGAQLEDILIVSRNRYNDISRLETV